MGTLHKSWFNLPTDFTKKGFYIKRWQQKITPFYARECILTQLQKWYLNSGLSEFKIQIFLMASGEPEYSEWVQKDHYKQAWHFLQRTWISFVIMGGKLIKLQQIIIIKIALKGEKMSRLNNGKLWNVYSKRELHLHQVATSNLLYWAQQLELGSPFPARWDAEVVPKGEGHPYHSDGCLS